MLRKASIILSIFALLGAAIATPASAEQRGRNAHVNRSVHVNRNVTVNRNVRVNRNVNVRRGGGTRFVIGRRYNGHVWYGHNRHRWHGRWYAYGVGPCWINIGGEWFWNVAICP